MIALQRFWYCRWSRQICRSERGVRPWFPPSDQASGVFSRFYFSRTVCVYLLASPLWCAPIPWCGWMQINWISLSFICMRPCCYVYV